MSSYRSLAFSASILLLFLGAGCNLSLTNKNSSPTPSTSVAQVRSDNNRDTRLGPIIEEYLTTHLGAGTHKGKIVASYVKYDEDEKDGVLTQYLWMNTEEFYQVGAKLARANARTGPVLIKLTKDMGGDNYTKVVGHQIPDPKNYQGSLARIFPKTVLDKISVTPAEANKRTQLLIQENGTKAQNLFGVNARLDIDQERHDKCLDLTFQNFVTPEIQGNEAVDVIFDGSSLPSLGSWKAAREGIEQDHTFDRRYVVRSIGCGNKCFDHHIIDTKDNKEIKYLRSQYGLDIGSNSRLLIVNPYRYILDPQSKGVTTQFYVMNETDPNHPRLELQCSYTDNSNSSVRPPVLELDTSTPQTPSDSTSTRVHNRRYINTDPLQCAAMDIRCADNENVFTDDSGCGCELVLK
jgi:hypothetical protein